MPFGTRLDHVQACHACGMAVGQRQAGVEQQAVAVLHQPMAHEAQLGRAWPRDRWSRHACHSSAFGHRSPLRNCARRLQPAARPSRPAPVVEGCLQDPVLAVQLPLPGSRLVLLQHTDDLLLTERLFFISVSFDGVQFKPRALQGAMSALCRFAFLCDVVPREGLEPPTYRLQGGCSTN
jgi:hypothetical protein